VLTSARTHVLFLFARSHRAQPRSTPAKREAVIAGPASEGPASEGPALTLGSAEVGSSAIVGPTPTDPVDLRKCARDLKALSAATEYTNEERGGGRDPGVRRPGAGRGQRPARSKIFRATIVTSCICHKFRKTKFASVKSLDSSYSDSEFSLFEFRFTVFFHESPPFSFLKPRKEKSPKRPGANT